MDALLGIDIGGTSIKAGLFTMDGDLSDVRTIPTGAIVDEGAYSEICAGLDALLTDNGFAPDDVMALGLDVPGPVDAAGHVGVLANIKLDPDGLRLALKTHYKRASLAFVNDANAAALGELWKGAARGHGSSVMVTLGTGVGGGIIVNDRLVAGAFGAGGEIGHMTMDPDETRACGCGGYGHLEQYCSATGLVTLYKEECESRGVQGAEVNYASDSLTVFQALAAGDECAKSALDKMLAKLAMAFAQIAVIVDPEIFIIGGGMAGSFDVFADDLKAIYDELAFGPCKNAQIVAAELGNKAGMYGCAYEALRGTKA